MNALILCATLIGGIDSNTDVPKPLPGIPGLDANVPLPLGSPCISSLCLRIGNSIRTIRHEPLRQGSEGYTYLQFGPRLLGLGHRWFIGTNGAASVEVECGPDGYGLTVKGIWYPIAGVGLEFGIDLLRLRPWAAVMLPL